MKILKIKGGDWGLKLLALVLALVIYHTLKNKAEGRHQKENDRTFLQTR